MTANILSGAEIAGQIKREVAETVKNLTYQPCLVAVRVGEDAASKVYVGSKIKTSGELGIRSEYIQLPETTTQAELLKIVEDLNAREDVDGILVQLPLPKQIDENAILQKINPEKDVDGFHPINAGKLAQGQKALTPCTPAVEGETRLTVGAILSDPALVPGALPTAKSAEVVIGEACAVTTKSPPTAGCALSNPVALIEPPPAGTA